MNPTFTVAMFSFHLNCCKMVQFMVLSEAVPNSAVELSCFILILYLKLIILILIGSHSLL